MDRLIVMDDVSGVADNCKKFAEFLTVCRKDKYHWKKTQIWKKQKICNIFPSSVPYNTVLKILHSNCKQTQKNIYSGMLYVVT